MPGAKPCSELCPGGAQSASATFGSLCVGHSCRADVSGLGENRGGRGGDRSQPHLWGQAASEPAGPTQGRGRGFQELLHCGSQTCLTYHFPFQGEKTSLSSVSGALGCFRPQPLDPAPVLASSNTGNSVSLSPVAKAPSGFLLREVPGLCWVCPGGRCLAPRSWERCSWERCPGKPPDSLLSPAQCSECGSLFYSQLEPSPDWEDPAGLAGGMWETRLPFPFSQKASPSPLVPFSLLHLNVRWVFPTLEGWKKPEKP